MVKLYWNKPLVNMKSYSCVSRLTAEHIQTIITSVKKVDNAILTQVWDKPPRRSIRGIVIKNTGNIRIYRPRVFHVGYEPNQSYSPECDWELLSPSSTWKVKGRT